MTLDDRLRAAGRGLTESVSAAQSHRDYDAFKAEYERRTASPMAMRGFDELIASLDSELSHPEPSPLIQDVVAPATFASTVSSHARSGEAAQARLGKAAESLRPRGGIAVLYGPGDSEDDPATCPPSSEKGRRIVGAERQTLAKDLVRRYTAGETIRALAASTGRSYGFIHRVLTESGVQLRQRSGARRRKKA
jgi:hypothetical protein